MPDLENFILPRIVITGGAPRVQNEIFQTLSVTAKNWSTLAGWVEPRDQLSCGMV